MNIDMSRFKKSDGNLKLDDSFAITNKIKRPYAEGRFLYGRKLSNIFLARLVYKIMIYY